MSDDDFDESDMFEYGNAFKTVSLAGTYLVDGMTMLWFSISLQLMLGDTTW